MWRKLGTFSFGLKKSKYNCKTIKKYLLVVNTYLTRMLLDNEFSLILPTKQGKTKITYFKTQKIFLLWKNWKKKNRMRLQGNQNASFNNKILEMSFILVYSRLYRALIETFAHCLKITQNVAFEFWHFPPIFVLLKLTCLVTLFERKLHFF